MGIFEKLQKVEKKIQRLIEGQFGEEAAREPLEVRRKILEEIEEKIRSVGGKRVFPFNGLVIHLLGSDPDSHAVWQAAFIDTHQIEDDVRHLLDESKCEAPPDLQVTVRVAGEATPELGRIDKKGFHIQYSRRVPREKKKIAPAPHAHLRVIRGKARRKRCPVGFPQTNIGRLREVLDSSGRVIRRNDLAFLDVDDETNATVSRAHAHIRFERESGDFRVSDDGSAHGTHLMRDGRFIEVPSGARRGVKLHSGDLIHLGRASVQFEIKSKPRP